MDKTAMSSRITMYFICEEDVGVKSNIIHGCYTDIEQAKREWKEMEGNPNCDVSFYLMKAECDHILQPNEWYDLKLEPIAFSTYE